MQGSVCVQSEDTLLLKAPKDSHGMKSAERGVSQSIHKFTFTQVYTICFISESYGYWVMVWCLF